MLRMRAVLPLAAPALALIVAAFVWAPEAAPLSPAEVQGVYAVRLSGEAWLRADADAGGPQAATRVEQKTRGTAFLELGVADAQADDGVVTVEIRLGSKHEGSALDRLTGSPDFYGTGLLTGERLTVIDVGAPGFVSALNLRFDRRARKFVGGWVVAYPAKSRDAAFTGGANVTLKGKRLRARRGKPAPTLPPLSDAALQARQQNR